MEDKDVPPRQYFIPLPKARTRPGGTIREGPRTFGSRRGGQFQYWRCNLLRLRFPVFGARFWPTERRHRGRALVRLAGH